MTPETSTTHLTGWIQPGECFFAGDDLHMNVDGTFAGADARIAICLADARRHGFPPAAGSIAAALGNWLELSGTFKPTTLADVDCDPEYSGELQVLAIDISHRQAARPGADPGANAGRKIVRKTITALLPAAIPLLPAQPSA